MVETGRDTHLSKFINIFLLPWPFIRYNLFKNNQRVFGKLVVGQETVTSAEARINTWSLFYPMIYCVGKLAAIELCDNNRL